MLILLSSTSAARYREDVLRCLSAPLGSALQFRYRRSLLSDELLLRLENEKLSGPGLVCFLDSDAVDALPVVPVRFVEVTDVRAHGTTISVALEMREFAYAETSTFTEELGKAAKGMNPHRVGQDVVGKYFFDSSDALTSVKASASVDGWEQTVSTVRARDPFKSEPFFWTVLGVEQEGQTLATERLSKWPMTPIRGSFSILIYHYQESGAPSPNSTLSLLGGKAIENIGHSELRIDSRYDLKRWRFEPRTAGYFATETWLRFGVANTWDLDLSLEIGGSLWLNLAKSAIVGTLIAIPSIVALAPQKDLDFGMKLILLSLCLLAGFGAALAVVFGIEKIG